MEFSDTIDFGESLFTVGEDFFRQNVKPEDIGLTLEYPDRSIKKVRKKSEKVCSEKSWKSSGNEEIKRSGWVMTHDPIPNPPDYRNLT